MSQQRTRDVLDQLRAFHERLAQWYSGQEGGADRQRMKLLLGYLSRHEANMATALQRFEEQASQKVLDTWFMFAPDTEHLFADGQRLLESATDADEVVRVALELDDRIVEAYRAMERESHIPEVREAFSALVVMEEQELHKVVRSVVGLGDM